MLKDAQAVEAFFKAVGDSVQELQRRYGATDGDVAQAMFAIAGACLRDQDGVSKIGRDLIIEAENRLAPKTRN